VKPFIQARGYTLSDSYIPYPLAYALFLFTDWTLWAIRLIHEVNLEVGKLIHTFIRYRISSAWHTVWFAMCPSCPIDPWA